jgi:hypothetical protein
MADRRAEELLASFLTPEQQADWRIRRAFNVRGSNGNLYRLDHTQAYSNMGCVQGGTGMGLAVWCEGLDIPADWALGLMFHLQAHESEVIRTGCKVYYGSRFWPTDYGGKL